MTQHLKHARAWVPRAARLTCGRGRRTDGSAPLPHGLPGAAPRMPGEYDTDSLDVDALLAEVDAMVV